MSLTGYDDINVGNYPQDAQVALGYVDGNWPTFNQGLRQQCPNAFLVSITTGTGPADVIDRENGDADAWTAAHWVKSRKAQGLIAIGYCSFGVWQEFRDACAAINTAPDGYWIADYDHDPNIPQEWIDLGCVGKQYESNDRFDISTILDSWPGLVTPGTVYNPSDWLLWAA